MDACLTQERMWLPLGDMIRQGLMGLKCRLAAVFAAEDSQIQQAVSRAVINEQAGRMLTDHGNAILRLAYSYLHNMADAEEVLQDALVRFLKTAPVLETKEHEKAWLLRVAANLSKNRIKYNALRETDELVEELAAEERDDLIFVWEAVKTLPKKYREVVHLYYHEGYTTAQIAELLGKKKATVRSDLARGRERLRAVLKEVYDFA